MNILCLTKINHVDGVHEKLASLGSLVCQSAWLNESAVRNAIIANNSEVLYVNPNKQSYILDRSVLGGTTVIIIVTVSRGTNHIDMDYCQEAGIRVIHLNKDPVTAKNSATAEHALGLTLALIRNLPQSFDAVKSGNWDCAPFIGHQLSSLTVGVVGMGTLGTMYASYCRAIGSKVIECTRQDGNSFINAMVNSDIISLHIPLTEKNYHFIDDRAIYLMKHGMFVVNTSRGSVVDEMAIIDGLRSGKIGGYATDVLEDEKGDILNNPIVMATEEGLNVIVTPHVAGTCFESAKVAHFRAIELLEEHYGKT